MRKNTWDPNIYLKNEGLRTRPAVDLAERIPAGNPARITDLGCGPGNSTGILKQKWPDAIITGLDSSREMISKAEKTDPDIRWTVCDIESWRPDQPQDIIFANASLHWVHGHADIFPRLFNHLSDDGILAIQMPNNFNAYSHTNIDKTLKALGLYEGISDKLLGDAVQNAEFYHNLMRPIAGHLDVWETEYMQVLTGDDPVYDWVKATTLLPVEANLSEEEFYSFSNDYRQRLRQSYPVADDGVTLFPFRRMFIVAGR